ncbi:MAG: hypothetical protein OXG35_13255 [Acidobacteria bacterium]|nr:hypothetical protein [Acidobacteriota bacterium]
MPKDGTNPFTDAESVRIAFGPHPYHPTNAEQERLLTDLNSLYTSLALRLHAELPAGPAKTTAIQALRRAMMKANACIMTPDA